MLGSVLAFCAGSAAVQHLPALPAPAWLLLPALAAAAAARIWPLAAACLCGFVWTAASAARLLTDDWPCGRDRERVDFEGQVLAPPTVRAGRVDFDLDVLDRTAGIALPGRVRLSWYEATAVPQPGQRWRATVRLRCRHGFANAGSPARELDLLRQRIGATGSIPGHSAPRLIADPAAERIVERQRARIARAIEAGAPQPASAAVLQGLAVGVRGGLPESLWDAFAITGVAHLMAISGLHVTACALSVLFLLRIGWRCLRLPAGTARIAIEMSVMVLVSAGYAVLAGASLPALRTLVMVAVVAWLRVLRRSLPVHQALALAALILVACDPLAMSAPGFWLSFVATAALLTVIEAGPGIVSYLAGFARTQAAVAALLAPVLVAVFGRLSLISPLANAVAIPFFCLLLLPAVLLATMATIAAPEASEPLWSWLATGLEPLWPWFEAAAQLPGASWEPSAQPLALTLAALLVILAALLVPWRGPVVAAAVAVLAVACGRAGMPAAGAFRLDVLDVGQGLAAVIQTERHVLVFDSGPRWRGGGAAARVTLFPFLHARGIRKVDRLIVSHGDADHAGGVDALRLTLPIGQILAGSGATIPAPASSCRRGQRWRWDGVEFEMLHPGPGDARNDNDGSCALAVRGAGGKALLLADPEAPAERELIGLRPAVDVVLLPHHGSRSSSSAALIAATGARLGIASAGFGNRWSMPHADVLARWRGAGTTVLTTGETGAVTVRFGAVPGAISVTTERGDHRRWWRP